MVCGDPLSMAIEPQKRWSATSSDVLKSALPGDKGALKEYKVEAGCTYWELARAMKSQYGLQGNVNSIAGDLCGKADPSQLKAGTTLKDLDKLVEKYGTVDQLGSGQTTGEAARAINREARRVNAQTRAKQSSPQGQNLSKKQRPPINPEANARIDAAIAQSLAAAANGATVDGSQPDTQPGPMNARDIINASREKAAAPAPKAAEPGFFSRIFSKIFS